MTTKVMASVDDAQADFVDVDDLVTPVGTPITDTLAGDGVTTTFALSETPTGTWAIVAVNGAVLLPSEYAITGGSVVFDTAPANASEVAVSYVFGGGLGGGADDTAMRIVGPFTVNYNSANVLTTGVTLWTPEAGYVIYNMWFDIPTVFTGSGGWSSSRIEIKTANDVLSPSTPFYPLVAAAGTAGLAWVDNGTDVVTRWVSDMLGVQAILGGYYENWFPARMKNSVPILLKLVPNAGTMTAGVLRTYAMVGELA